MVDRGALEVHGIEDEFLAKQPRFAEVAHEFLEFVNGAELVIHNADFDVEFIDHELRRIDGVPHADPRLLRGARHARARAADASRPAQQPRRARKRYNIDNSQRELHGALLDAQILAEIYLVDDRRAGRPVAR